MSIDSLLWDSEVVAIINGGSRPQWSIPTRYFISCTRHSSVNGRLRTKCTDINQYIQLLIYSHDLSFLCVHTLGINKSNAWFEINCWVYTATKHDATRGKQIHAAKYCLYPYSEKSITSFAKGMWFWIHSLNVTLPAWSQYFNKLYKTQLGKRKVAYKMYRY